MDGWYELHSLRLNLKRDGQGGGSITTNVVLKYQICYRSSVHDLELGDLQEVVSYGRTEVLRDFFIGLTLGFFLRNVVAFFFCLTEDTIRPRYDDAARNCVVSFFCLPLHIIPS